MNYAEETLKRLIILHGDTLNQKAPWCDGVAALGALAEIESSFGKYNIPKHENAFDVGGKLFSKSLWERWGAWAACSYSSWQLMFPVAVELGFTGRPQDLWDDETAILWVMEYIERRILKRGCTTIEDFADAYNSGSFKDNIVPRVYIVKFVSAYHTIRQRRNLTKGGSNG